MNRLYYVCSITHLLQVFSWKSGIAFDCSEAWHFYTISFRVQFYYYRFPKVFLTFSCLVQLNFGSLGAFASGVLKLMLILVPVGFGRWLLQFGLSFSCRCAFCQLDFWSRLVKRIRRGQFGLVVVFLNGYRLDVSIRRRC